jgi:hypothetical protein
MRIPCSKVDPGGPSEILPWRSLCVDFCGVLHIVIHFMLADGAVSSLGGLRSPLRSTCFPVYASNVTFDVLAQTFLGEFDPVLGVLPLSFKHRGLGCPPPVWTSPHVCNTRYGWLVRPYPAGSFTLQEAPSFAWRTNDRVEQRKGAATKGSIQAKTRPAVSRLLQRGLGRVSPFKGIYYGWYLHNYTLSNGYFRK